MKKKTVELALQLADKLETKEEKALWVYKQLKMDPQLLREVVMIWVKHERAEAIKLLGQAKVQYIVSLY